MGEEKQGELWFLTLFVRLAALAAMNAMVMGEIGTGILTGLGVGQELEVQPRGTFKPSGGWVKAGTVKRRARKPATARVGDVAVDSTSPSAESSTNAAGTSTATKSADEDSAEVATLTRRPADRQAHLPAPVRASVLRRAKRPDHYYDSAWRTGGREPGSLPRYVSQILRMNECEAVVISASRIGEDPRGAAPSTPTTCAPRSRTAARRWAAADVRLRGSARATSPRAGWGAEHAGAGEPAPAPGAVRPAPRGRGTMGA